MSIKATHALILCLISFGMGYLAHMHQEEASWAARTFLAWSWRVASGEKQCPANFTCVPQ